MAKIYLQISQSVAAPDHVFRNVLFCPLDGFPDWHQRLRVVSGMQKWRKYFGIWKKFHAK